jgi:hypothetical protein
VAEAAVIRKLEGHESDPVELSAAPGAPRLLLALCRDGGVALWDVAQGEALAAAPRSDAFSAVRRRAAAVEGAAPFPALFDR